MLYTLADLTKLTGLKRRTVQLWAEAGAIEAEPETERAGPGTHRRFSRKEAIIALVLKTFAEEHISIGQLMKIADAARTLFNGGGEGGDGTPYWDDLEECIAGNRQVYYIIVAFEGKFQSTVHVPYPEAKFEDTCTYIGMKMIEHESKRGATSKLLTLKSHLYPLR